MRKTNLFRIESVALRRTAIEWPTSLQNLDDTIYGVQNERAYINGATIEEDRARTIRPIAFRNLTTPDDYKDIVISTITFLVAAACMEEHQGLLQFWQLLSRWDCGQSVQCRKYTCGEHRTHEQELPGSNLSKHETFSYCPQVSVGFPSPCFKQECILIRDRL